MFLVKYLMFPHYTTLFLLYLIFPACRITPWMFVGINSLLYIKHCFLLINVSMLQYTVPDYLMFPWYVSVPGYLMFPW